MTRRRDNDDTHGSACLFIACSEFLPSVRSSQQSVRDAARVMDAVEGSSPRTRRKSTASATSGPAIVRPSTAEPAIVRPFTSAHGATSALRPTVQVCILKSQWFCALPVASAGGGQRPKRLGLPTDAVRFWHLSASSSRAQIPQPPGRSPPGGLSRQSVKPQPGLRLSSSVADAPLVGGAHVDLRSTTKIHQDSE